VTSAELEHPQPVDRRALFRAYMRRLDPKADPAIALRDGSYVPSPHATSSHVATRLEIEPTSSHLIIGAVGSGKTTELLAINDRLASSSDIVPLFIDVPSLQNLIKLREGVLIGLAWTQIWRYISENQSELAAKHMREARFADSAATGYYVQDPSEIDDDDDRYLHVPGLITTPEKNISLERIKKTFRAVLGESSLRYVILFDGLDRSRKTDVLIATLVSDLSELSTIGVGSVVVGPPELRGEVYHQFTEQFATFHFHGATDISTAAGVGFLEDVLKKRTDEAILGEEERRRIVQWSGGITRDLIALARNAGEIAYTLGAECISREHVDVAADRFGRALLLGLSKDATKRLTGIYGQLRPFREPKRIFIEFTASSDVDIDLLVRRLVIEFPDFPPRFSLHPTIRPLLSPTPFCCSAAHGSWSYSSTRSSSKAWGGSSPRSTSFFPRSRMAKAPCMSSRHRTLGQMSLHVSAAIQTTT
jgi:energy-coupling factor transporter ATP-binding protein EcfA2